MKTERTTQSHRCCILATGCDCKKEKGNTGHHNGTVITRPGEGRLRPPRLQGSVVPVNPAIPVFMQQHHCCNGGRGGRRFVKQRRHCFAAMSCCDGGAATSAVLGGCNGALLPVLQMESSRALQWRLAGAPDAAMERSPGGLGAAMQLAGAAMERSPELPRALQCSARRHCNGALAGAPSGAAMKRSPVVSELRCSSRDYNGALTGGVPVLP